MSDIALKRLENGRYDVDFDEISNDLNLSDGFENSVVISLLSFFREKTIVSGKLNKNPCIGGYWGDSVHDGDHSGSGIFEMMQKSIGEDTAKEVEKMSLESLKWMKSDGIVNETSAEAKVVGKDIFLSISFKMPSGDEKKVEMNIIWCF